MEFIIVGDLWNCTASLGQLEYVRWHWLFCWITGFISFGRWLPLRPSLTQAASGANSTYDRSPNEMNEEEYTWLVLAICPNEGILCQSRRELIQNKVHIDSLPFIIMCLIWQHMQWWHVSSVLIRHIRVGTFPCNQTRGKLSCHFILAIHIL